MSARDVSGDPIVSSLLVICYGALEGYVSQMIERAVEAVGATCASIDELPESLLVENVFRTGRAYLTAKDGGGHRRFDFPALARALAGVRTRKPRVLAQRRLFRLRDRGCEPRKLEEGVE